MAIKNNDDNVRRRQESLEARIKARNLKTIKRVYGQSNRNIPPGPSAFISGGIGDVFAVEGFMTPQQRSQLETIYYATAKTKPIKLLFKSLNSFPKLTHHVSVWSDFSQFWCFYSLEECIEFMDKKKVCPDNMRNAFDLSILKVFHEVKQGNLTYNESSFIKDTLCNIGHLELPKLYVVIAPYSTDKRMKDRDFSHEDWRECLKFLERKNIKGVVINFGEEQVPKSPYLINLANQLDVMECIEVVKSSSGYVGIDSWLSVIATKSSDVSFLQVKSVNEHCYNNAQCYYAPKTDYSFMTRRIDHTKINDKEY